MARIEMAWTEMNRDRYNRLSDYRASKSITIRLDAMGLHTEALRLSDPSFDKPSR